MRARLDPNLVQLEEKRIMDRARAAIEEGDDDEDSDGAGEGGGDDDGDGQHEGVSNNGDGGGGSGGGGGGGGRRRRTIAARRVKKNRYASVVKKLFVDLNEYRVARSGESAAWSYRCVLDGHVLWEPSALGKRPSSTSRRSKYIRCDNYDVFLHHQPLCAPLAFARDCLRLPVIVPCFAERSAVANLLPSLIF